MRLRLTLFRSLSLFVALTMPLALFIAPVGAVQSRPSGGMTHASSSLLPPWASPSASHPAGATKASDQGMPEPDQPPPRVSTHTTSPSEPPPECSLLDDPAKRRLMSAAFETKLLVLCGRAGELGRVRSTGGPKAPSLPSVLGDDVLVSDPDGEPSDVNFSQNETALARNEDTGVLCSAYNNSYTGFQLGAGFTGFAHSDDDGATWHDHGSIDPNSWGDPATVWRRKDGHFYHASLLSNGIGLWDLGSGCTSATFVGMVHVGGSDDKEMLAVNNDPTSPYYGYLYVVWTNFADGHIYLTYSADGGQNWSAPRDISGHSSVQGAWPAVDPTTGDLYVGWVHYDISPDTIDIEIVRVGSGGGGLIVPLTNPMSNQGNPKQITATTACGTDALNGYIRYLPAPQLAVDADGNLHVVYSYDPDGPGGDSVNVYYRRRSGLTWDSEIQLNDDGTQTDQFFPALAVADNGTVAAFWYDRRLDTTDNYLYDYYKAVSYDNGASFEPNERVSDVSSPVVLDPGLAACYHGDYDTSVAGNGRFYIQWADDRRGDPAVYLDTEPFLTTGIQGIVYDADTQRGIENARLVAALQPTGTLYFGDSGTGGSYELYVPPGDYQINAAAYGYQPTVVASTVQDWTQSNIPLSPADRWHVSGTVADSNTGYPLYASITILGDPFNPPPPENEATSDSLTGYYSVTLPAFITYTFIVESPGYYTGIYTVSQLTGDTAADFTLDPILASCDILGYEKIPIFSDGFESGTLGSAWSISTTNEGRVTVSDTYPYAGNYSVLLDDSGPNLTFSLASLVLQQDLSDMPNVALDFWWRGFYDEDHPQDGVFISDDGSAWYEVLSFNNGPLDFRNDVVDISGEAADNGLTLNDQFRIKFQFYDNYPIPSDGYAIDNVLLYTCQPYSDAVVLQPEYTQDGGCPCTPHPYTLYFVNHSGLTDTVVITYAVSPYVTVMEIPATLEEVPAGGIQSFDVVLRLDEDAPVGEPAFVTVTASLSHYPAYSSTAVIERQPLTLDPAGWQVQPIATVPTDTHPAYWHAGVVGTSTLAAGEVAYYAGGLDENRDMLDALQMYDPGTMTWTQMATMPLPVFGAVASWIDGKLYLSGGYRDTSFTGVTDTQVYDPASNTWDDTTPADIPASGGRGGAAGGKGTCHTGSGECHFQVGGSAAGSFLSSTLETWEYNPASNTWTRLQDRPRGSTPDGMILGGGVGCLGYIFVGGDYRGYSDFYRLDATQISGSQWITLTAIPADAGKMSPAMVCAPDERAIYLIGGDPIGYRGGYNSTVYRYAIDSDTWSGPLEQELNTASAGLAGVSMYDRLWVFGGSVSLGAITPPPHEALAQTCPACDQRLELNKNGPSWVYQGDRGTYALRLYNSGEPTATIALTDPLPSGVDYAGGLACDGGTCRYDSGDAAVYWEGAVAAYESVTITFDFTATAPVSTVVRNTALARYSVAGGSPAAPLKPPESTGLTLNWQFGPRRQVRTNSGAVETVRPLSYRYLAGGSAASNAPSAADFAHPHILACADTAISSPPDTCIERALRSLGQSYDMYYSDWDGCEAALRSGLYDLAVVGNENNYPHASLFDALEDFLADGGRAMINTFDMDAFPTHTLWAAIGISYTADVTTAPPVYRWQPTHPAVDGWPGDPLTFTDNYGDDGDRFTTLSNARALAGYTATQTSGETALVIRDDDRAIFSGFCIGNLNGVDQDTDGITDCVEIWQDGLEMLIPSALAASHEFHVHTPPVVTWTKSLYLNGVYIGAPEDGPFTAVPGDQLDVVDTLEYSGTLPLFIHLSTDWDGSPLLPGDTSHTTGAAVTRSTGLDWGVTLFPGGREQLAQTFTISDDLPIALVEWLEPDDMSPYSRTSILTPPALAKDGPHAPIVGAVVPYTIVLETADGLRGSPRLTDTLPPGVAYAGGLTYTYGVAWYEAATNAIYWSKESPFSGTTKSASHAPAHPAAPAPTARQGEPTAVSPAGAAKVRVRPAAANAITGSVLWDQPTTPADINAYLSQDFLTTTLDKYDMFIADDFVNSTRWDIDTIFVPGNTWNGGDSLTRSLSLEWQIYADAGGVPAGDPYDRGDLPAWSLSLPPTDTRITLGPGVWGNNTNVTLTLDYPLALPPGHWWLLFYPRMAFSTGGQYGRHVSDTSNGYDAQVVNPLEGFGYPSTWTSVRDAATWALPTQDFAFRLEGEPLPSVVTVTFNVTVTADPGERVTNTAVADYNGLPLTAAHVFTVPSPEYAWKKSVTVNGQSATDVEAGDQVQIVDAVLITYPLPVAFTLTETWSSSISLTDFISTSGGTSGGDDFLVWQVDGVPATWHILTKTYTVLTGTWDMDVVTETLAVDYLPPETRLVELHHAVPNIVLTPPALMTLLNPDDAFTQTLLVENTGDGDLDWTLTEGTPVAWLDESPTGGSVASGGSTPVAVRFDSTGLAVGVYTAALDIHSNDPDEPLATVPVTLEVQTGCIPVRIADLVHTPVTPTAGDGVAFIALIAQGDGPVTFTWDLGDGSPPQSGAWLDVVTHVYDAGEYTVTLLVENGCPSSDTVAVHLTVNPPPQPLWEKEVRLNGLLQSTSPVTLTSGDLLAVSDRVWITYSGAVSFTLHENWPDFLALTGQTATDGSVVQNGRLITWEVDSGLAGSWHVLTKTFSVSGGDWDGGVITESLWVDGADPQPADRRVELAHGCEPLAGVLISRQPAAPSTGDVVTFTATYSPNYATAPTFAWDFGDGQTGSGTPAYHSYVLSGTYTAILTAANGCSVITATHLVTVTGAPFTPRYGVSLAPSSAADSGEPGLAVVYTLRLTNTGNVADTFDLSASGHLWGTAVEPAAISLPPTTTHIVTVTVSVPADAACDQTDAVVIAVASVSSPTVGASSRLTTTVSAVHGVEIAPPTAHQTAAPGEEVTYTLRVTNSGNCTDTFTTAISGNLWPTTAPGSVGPLAAGAGADLPVTMSVPLTAVNGSTDTAHIVLTTGDGSTTGESWLTTEAVVPTHTLTVHTVGQGSVTVVPSRTFYYSGTNVRLMAIPSPGWYFGGWSGDLIGSDNPITLTMSADRSVTATFIGCRPPFGANFTFTPTRPTGRDTVLFTGTVLTGTAPFTYTWDFGDGSAPGTGNPITHVFPVTVTVQQYRVVMTATNGCGHAGAFHPVVVAPLRVYLPLVLRNR